ncbi:MAG: D-alanine--D-alanine ligase [PVC group bacterium]|nr:D-alanine--D-alanine ligase [PVC group bacterium]
MEVKKIGVLMGGFSSEREISLKSGKAVLGALQELGYYTTILDFESESDLIDKIQKSDIDCVFNALHGAFGEDGQVQKILEDLNVPYTGSGPRASELAMDKVASRNIFLDNNIPVPEGGIIDSENNIDNLSVSSFPVVIKPSREGSSIGLSIVEDKSTLAIAIKKALEFDQQVMIECYIEGREIAVGILDGNPLPVIEIVPKNRYYDFEAKYTEGMTEYLVPAVLPETIYLHAQALALKAHQLLGCRGFSRVDMIVDKKGTPVVLEVNTIPGLTSTSLLPKAALACGISFPELCRKMITGAVCVDTVDSR